MKSSVMFLIPEDEKPLMGGRGIPCIPPYCGNFVRKCSSEKLSLGFFWSSSIISLILAFNRFCRECLFPPIKLYHQILSLIIEDKFLHFSIGGKIREKVFRWWDR